MRKADVYLYKNEELHIEYRDLEIESLPDQLSFITGDVTNIIKYDENTFLFIRENLEFKFLLTLKPFLTCEYILKKQECSLDIEISEYELKIIKNKISFSYRIETDEELIKIEVILKEE